MKKRGYLKVWRRNFYLFRKTGWISALWMFFEPLIYMLAFGFGVGSFVQNMGDVSFLDFFFPGLLISTAALVSYQDATQSQYSRHSDLNLYSTWLLLPVSPKDIVIGEVMWSTFKGIASALGVALAGLALGLYQGWGFFACFLTIALVATLFSFFGTWMVSFARSADFFYLPLTGFIIPLILISGVLYPISTLILPLKVVTYLFPLSHAVELTRALLKERVQVGDVFHLIYLTLATYAAVVMGFRQFLKRLTT